MQSEQVDVQLVINELLRKVADLTYEVALLRAQHASSQATKESSNG